MNMKFRMNLMVWCVVVAILLPGVASAVKVGDRLPVFKAKDMKGNTVDLSKIIGHKPVALVFWSTWCTDCVKKLQEVNDLYKKWGYRGLRFVGINVGMNDSPEKAAKMVKELDIRYPIVFDKTGELSEKYRIKKVFCMIVAAKDGTVMMEYYDTVPIIDDNNFLVLKTYEKQEKSAGKD